MPSVGVAVCSHRRVSSRGVVLPNRPHKFFLIAAQVFPCYKLKHGSICFASICIGKAVIMSDQRYVEIPGSKTHELPPLLLHCATEADTDLTSVMLEAEDMLSASDAAEEILEQRKLDLAIHLAEQYKGLLSHWSWGDSVIEWIRQCEITFENEGVLRKLLHPDVWPHVSRASFVELLREKEIGRASCRGRV